MTSRSPSRSFVYILFFLGIHVFLCGQSPASLDWQSTTGGVIFSSPAIDANGNIYIGSNDNKLHSYDASGSLRWSYTTGNWVDSTPTLSEDGTVVYVGSWDNKLHAINSETGVGLWSFETNNYVTASVVLGSNGLIYFGSKDSVFYAIQPDGSPAWEYFAGNPIFGSAAVGEDGTLYFGDEGGVFHALQADGTLKWTFQTDEVSDFNNSILSSPAIDNLGNLYFGCGNGYFYSLSDEGSSASLNWKYLTGDRIDSSPVLGLNDEVFFAGRDGYLRSIPRFSTTLENIANWEVLVGDVFYSSPVVDTLGNVYTIAYTGGGENHLSCYAPSGNKLWDSSDSGFPFAIDGVVDSSLALTPGNKLYFGCYDYKLYCISLETGPADSDWPAFQRSSSRDGAWPSYTVSVSVSPSGSGDVEGAGTYARGSNLTLTALSSVKHVFSQWLNGSSVVSTDASYPLTLNENLSLTAEFLPTYNLTLSAGQGGTVTPTQNQSYHGGTSVSIEAVPETGYSFISWVGAGVVNSSSAETQVVMTEDRTISATFNLNTYTLTLSTTTGGEVSGFGEFTHGTSVSILASPSTGYHFTHWTGEGAANPDQPSTTVLMTEDCNLTAHFALNSYALQVLAGNGGSVSSGGTFPYGTNQSITATPEVGYSFVEWTGDGISQSSEANTSILITANQTVSATFEINSYDLNLTSGTGGTVDGNGSYNHGEFAQISATPASGYVFSGWSGTSPSLPAEPSIALEITSDLNLTAHFSPRAADKYLLQITEVPAQGGSTQGAREYDLNETAEILAIPANGYSFSGWEGTEISNPLEANTTLLISGDKNISAFFSINSYALAISSSPGGSTTGAAVYQYGTHAEITATAQPGYSFSGWSGAEVANPSLAQTTISMTEDHSISANFSIHRHTLTLFMSEGGAVEGGGTFDYGTSAPITAVPIDGYSFVEWSGDGISNPTSQNTTVLMNTNRIASAIFSKISYSFSMTSMEGGSATSEGNYEHGSTISLSASPLEGYEFSHWEGHPVASPTAMATTFQITKDSAITAVFKRLPGYWNDGWLGYSLLSEKDWMYVYPIGWVYSLTPETKNEYWLWHDTLDWLWFEKNTYSNAQIWMDSEKSWIFLDFSDWQNPTYYNYQTKTWADL